MTETIPDWLKTAIKTRLAGLEQDYICESESKLYIRISELNWVLSLEQP